MPVGVSLPGAGSSVTEIKEIDLNPALVGRRGEGLTILDALVKR